MQTTEEKHIKSKDVPIEFFEYTIEKMAKKIIYLIRVHSIITNLYPYLIRANKLNLRNYMLLVHRRSISKPFRVLCEHDCSPS